jgi:hypothetical protein
MAGLEFQAVNSAAVALAAATAKTIVAVTAPTNQKVLVGEWSVSFDGVTSSAVPVLCELVYFTAAGAGTKTSLTPSKRNASDGETIQATAGENYTVEPTVATVLDAILVSPTSGYKEIRPLRREVPIPGGKIVGIRCNAPAIVNVRGALIATE